MMRAVNVASECLAAAICKNTNVEQAELVAADMLGKGGKDYRRTYLGPWCSRGLQCLLIRTSNSSNAK